MPRRKKDPTAPTAPASAAAAAAAADDAPRPRGRPRRDRTRERERARERDTDDGERVVPWKLGALVVLVVAFGAHLLMRRREVRALEEANAVFGEAQRHYNATRSPDRTPSHEAPPRADTPAAS